MIVSSLNTRTKMGIAAGFRYFAWERTGSQEAREEPEESSEGLDTRKALNFGTPLVPTPNNKAKQGKSGYRPKWQKPL
jgi:hypothetical protein